jgi:hypothetical protein
MFTVRRDREVKSMERLKGGQGTNHGNASIVVFLSSKQSKDMAISFKKIK